MERAPLGLRLIVHERGLLHVELTADDGEGASLVGGAPLKAAAIDTEDAPLDNDLAREHEAVELDGRPRRHGQERRGAFDGDQKGAALADQRHLYRGRAGIEGGACGAAVEVVGAVCEVDDGGQATRVWRARPLQRALQRALSTHASGLDHVRHRRRRRRGRRR